MLVRGHTCIAITISIEEAVPETIAMKRRRKVSDRAQGEWWWGTCFTRRQNCEATAIESEWLWSRDRQVDPRKNRQAGDTAPHL